MQPPTTVEAQVEAGAEIIAGAFHKYREDFKQMTLRARSRFEQRDWQAGQHDSAERLDLYRGAVQFSATAITDVLGTQLKVRPIWRAIKVAFSQRVASRPDLELAETFFNSVTRRVFVTVGVDRDLEFVEPMAPRVEQTPHAGVTEVFRRTGPIGNLIRQILVRFSFSVPYEDLDRDAELIGAQVENYMAGVPLWTIEVARPVFFRNKAAYLVGKIHGARADSPFVLALLNPDGRVVADAVLLTEDEASIVFSFTRSYFLVDVESPRALVAFLQSIMPRKLTAELYISIGCNKQGKTELFRALRRHLEHSADLFEIAPGARGMVMIVFTLPSLDLIFKIFRDRFDYPKTTTRQEVMEKYQLVFKHDRAGRLVDAQEFEYMEFDRHRFSAPLLKELLTQAAETVTVQGDSLVFRHVYIERRLTPLDLFLREASEREAREAVSDYGEALRDLAATNIFPGDLLLKNFGVTRHNRLVFYDYDELCLLKDCNFRKLPTPRDDADEVAADPWYYVGDKDIFPEEFLPFLGLQGQLRELFLAEHGDLLDTPFWRRMQEQHGTGRVIDVFPYPAAKRLRHDPGEAEVRY